MGHMRRVKRALMKAKNIDVKTISAMKTKRGHVVYKITSAIKKYFIKCA